MVDEYTPTTEDIIRYFDAPPYKIDPQREGEDFASYLGRVSIETMHSRMASEAAARRWLAAHDREVAAKALRGAASHVDGFAEILRGVIPLEDPGADQRSRAYSQAAGYLRREADRIEEGASDGEQ